MKRALLPLLLLSGCQVTSVGERLFACGDGGTCPEGYACSAEDGLCLLEGELCVGSIPIDLDAGPFDVTFEDDLSRFAHDQDLPTGKCSPAARGPEVFYDFVGSGPFSATVTHEGNWRPMVSVQKCDVNSDGNRCAEESLNVSQLDPGYWRVAVSSVTPGGGPFSVRIRGVKLVAGDYCGADLRLNFLPGADGGLSATSRVDTTPLVSWPQTLWGCGTAPARHDAVFIAQGRADGGRVTARTSASFRHWAQWRGANVSCTAAGLYDCEEATQLSDGGWRATVSGPALANGDAWLWVGGVGDGGVYDVQVDLR